MLCDRYTQDTEARHPKDDYRDDDASLHISDSFTDSLTYAIPGRSLQLGAIGDLMLHYCEYTDAVFSTSSLYL